MALYTSLAELQARYTAYNVRFAFTGKGEGTVADPDATATVNPTIQRAMNLIHSILSPNITVPFSSPFPGQLVDITQELTMLFARKDATGGVLPDALKKDWDSIITTLRNVAAGKVKWDGVGLASNAAFKTNNDDGRRVNFTNWHYDQFGNRIESDNTVPTTERIL